MPLYEYRCAKCGKTIEALQKFSDAPLKRHKDCGGSMTRLVSASSFQLKGGGWYASGYSKEAPKSESRSESKSESKTESSNETKTESSKTESKTDSAPATTAESKPAAKSKSSKKN